MAGSRQWLVAAALTAAPVAAHAQEQVPDATAVRISLGTTYSSGTYGGAATTRVYSAPLSLRVSRKHWFVRVAVPFVHISGPGTLIDTPQGRDGGTTAGDGDADDSAGGTEVDDDESCETAAATTESDGDECPVAGAATALAATTPAQGARSGLGDVSVTLGYGLSIAPSTTFDLSARVKLPTASRRRGLGTGKADVTLSGTLSQDLGAFTLWAGGRRRFVGKPAALNLRDTWGAGGGLVVRTHGALSFGADYDWQQSATARRSFSEVTSWVAMPLAERLRISAYAGAGLNSRSAKFTAGASLTWKLN